jgi:hypothetical protein
MPSRGPSGIHGTSGKMQRKAEEVARACVLSACPPTFAEPTQISPFFWTTMTSCGARNWLRLELPMNVGLGQCVPPQPLLFPARSRSQSEAHRRGRSPRPRTAPIVFKRSGNASASILARSAVAQRVAMGQRGAVEGLYNDRAAAVPGRAARSFGLSVALRNAKQNGGSTRGEIDGKSAVFGQRPLTLNQRAAGSSPAAPTINIKNLRD